MSEQPRKAYSAKEEQITIRVMNTLSRWQVRVYELTGGRIWNTLRGVPVAILTVTGRKSGVPRKVALLYMRWEDNVVMVASKAGTSKTPLWYRNAQANPEVQIQIGKERKQYRMRAVREEEEAELWPRLDAIYPEFSDYRQRTEGLRKIPLCVFEPH